MRVLIRLTASPCTVSWDWAQDTNFGASIVLVKAYLNQADQNDRYYEQNEDEDH